MGFPLILVDGCWKYQWQYSWTFVVEIDMYICKDYVHISGQVVQKSIYKAEDVTITAEIQSSLLFCSYAYSNISKAGKVKRDSYDRDTVWNWSLVS